VAKLSGSSSADIDAPIQRCYALVTDPDATAQWQASVKRTEVLERDEQERATLVRTHIDAIVRELSVDLRFSFAEPNELGWKREGGDLSDVQGTWRFDDLGDGRTRATYTLELDPGRMLGMLARGPVGDQLRKHLTRQPPEGLKQAAEAR
jgi:uncharacterized protein YndB with AHSA1/START domain